MQAAISPTIDAAVATVIKICHSSVNILSADQYNFLFHTSKQGMLKLFLVTLFQLAAANVEVVEHVTSDTPSPPPSPSVWEQPWSIAAVIFSIILAMLLFARCIFSVCEISCDREDDESVATQSAVEVTLRKP